MKTADELRAAIERLSPAAKQHLQDHPSPGVGSAIYRPSDVLYALNRFEHENRWALRKLPARDLMGRPDKPHEEFLIYQLRRAWTEAFEGQPPARGWRPFRKACADPLAKFGPAGLPARSDRAWEALLASAQRRAMCEGKSSE